MQPLSTFETKRLCLRKPTIKDAISIFEQYAGDPEVTKYLSWQPHKFISQTNKYIDRCLWAWNSKSAFPFVLIRQKDSQLIGMIEIRISKHKADLGYVLAKSEWGKGYMPEAAKVITDWALRQNNIYRVWAVCDLENDSSARVMEKIGMQKEGILKRWLIHPNIAPQPRDCLCYSVNK
jgi:[ribosomal protein S5]-alanine N-acetyltransferase